MSALPRRRRATDAIAVGHPNLILQKGDREVIADAISKMLIAALQLGADAALPPSATHKGDS